MLVMFWKNLKSVLDFQGVSIKELAEKAGLQQQSIYNGITRDSSPSLETALKIASVLNVSVEYLATGKDTNPYAEENKRLQEKIKSIADIVYNK